MDDQRQQIIDDMRSGSMSKALKLASAFDRWRSLDRQLETLGPKAVSPEAMADAWRALLQAHEEWSNSR